MINATVSLTRVRLVLSRAADHFRFRRGEPVLVDIPDFAQHCAVHRFYFFREVASLDRQSGVANENTRQGCQENFHP